LDSHGRLLDKVGHDGDKQSRQLVDIICTEEVDHVRKGLKWFKFLCERESLQPVATFHSLMKTLLDTPLPPPFNSIAREKAGMTPEYYMPLAMQPSSHVKAKKEVS